VSKAGGNTAEIRRLEVSGSFAEMGAAHGETCRDEIVALYEVRRDIIGSECPRLTTGRLRTVCTGLWECVAGQHNELTSEVAATATAATLDPWQMIVAGAYTDVLDVCREKASRGRDECTVGVSADRKFIAGTWDSHSSAVEALVLLTRRPDVGPATLALTTAGWPAQQGVNDAGIAFAITNLTPQTARPAGLPYIAANALLASATSVEWFVSLAEREHFCSGHSYLLTDGRGNAAIIETSDHGVDAWSVDRNEAHANHYRTLSTIDNNSSYEYLTGSVAREEELANVMEQVDGPETFGSALLESRHINRTDADGGAVTCAFFFLDAQRAEMWYRRGPARGEAMKLATL
jgi:hypothetical protein